MFNLRLFASEFIRVWVMAPFTWESGSFQPGETTLYECEDDWMTWIGGGEPYWQMSAN